MFNFNFNSASLVPALTTAGSFGWRFIKGTFRVSWFCLSAILIAMWWVVIFIGFIFGGFPSGGGSND